MRLYLPSRLGLGAALVVLLACGPVYAHGRAPKGAAPPAPRVQRAQPNPVARPGAGIAARPAENQEHLERWMQKHQNLPLDEQLRQLQTMPGFRDLPPQIQQRESNEYTRLYNMNPQQRSQTLQRNENLERLTLPQRQEWRNAVQQLNSLPAPRRRIMARVILDLREMPPDQRQLTLNSPNFRAQFAEGERTMLSTLLTVEPYPPVAPTPAP